LVKVLTVENALGPVLDVGAKAVSRVARVYDARPVVRASIDACTLLLLLLAFHWALGFTQALQPLYLIPVWYASKNEGSRSAVAAAVFAAALLTLTPAGGYGALWEAGVRILVVALFCRLFIHNEAVLLESREQAVRDPLTGVYNRTALEEHGPRLIRRSLLSGQQLSVAVIDCNKFKQLNDEYGHAYGDFVLRALANLLTKSVKNTGLVARTGGDEFVVIIPKRGRTDARKILERVADKFWIATYLDGVGASMSVGIASLGDDGNDLEKLLHAADERMYVQKGVRPACA
jgi:diguanylate cyclase (GGDEF)-like protein